MIDEEALFEAIAHGDDAHREWLRHAIYNFARGIKPPKPYGKGTTPTAWKCKQCHRVWAPHVAACGPCNSKLSATSDWNFTGDDESFT